MCLSLQHSCHPERLVLLNSGTCSRNLEEAHCSPSAHFKFGDQKNLRLSLGPASFNSASAHVRKISDSGICCRQKMFRWGTTSSVVQGSFFLQDCVEMWHQHPHFQSQGLPNTSDALDGLKTRTQSNASFHLTDETTLSILFLGFFFSRLEHITVRLDACVKNLRINQLKSSRFAVSHFPKTH